MLFPSTSFRAAPPLALKHRPLIHTRNARKVANIDPKLALLRSTLYPPNRRNTDGSPVGVYRPDVFYSLNKIIQNPIVHDTIERAWKLHLRHVRKAREAEAERKFNSMKRAMEELEKVDPRLAHAASKGYDPSERSEEEKEIHKEVRGAARRALDARIPGLFPRDMRVPTDTPPTSGWDHAWKPPQVKK